jgi:hypothetical protein
VRTCVRVRACECFCVRACVLVGQCVYVRGRVRRFVQSAWRLKCAYASWMGVSAEPGVGERGTDLGLLHRTRCVAAPRVRLQRRGI